MSDDKNQDFVEIPTMTIRKPKKKQEQSRLIVMLAAAVMVIGIIFLAIAMIFWL